MKEITRRDFLMGTTAGMVTVMASMMMESTIIASASESEELTPGVTVVADAESATGYTAHFVYEDAEAESVALLAGFSFLTDDGVAGRTSSTTAYTAYEWTPETYPVQVVGTYAYEKVEGTDYWTLSLPMPSGHYWYYLMIDGENMISDPANPGMSADAENGHEDAGSFFFVPYDEEKQNGTIDYTFAMPREDGQSGEVSFVNYQDLNGDTQALGVYLPYGYDAEREEGYKVLYIGHGGGGSEVEWFSNGTQYIFDNLIAEGTVEPTIIVTMYNTGYEWDYEVINENLMNYIIPYVEENYNVGTEVADRAFAGESMGGMTTCNVYYSYADQFGYFGIFSGADVRDLTEMDIEVLGQPTIMVGAGLYDSAYVNTTYNTDEDRSTLGFIDSLDAAEIPYTVHIVKGGHDFFTWSQLIRLFAEECLWK
ncbi:MAG: hypothetical protein LIP11_04375 [Clostridiales bacterium]|nr:hypothetical protein [Clostridiales bacterium]